MFSIHLDTHFGSKQLFKAAGIGEFFSYTPDLAIWKAVTFPSMEEAENFADKHYANQAICICECFND
jgi:hypothetical protein